MLFQSFPFMFALLPVTLALFWLSPNIRYKQAVVLTASYIFYGYWDWRFCGLILLSSLVDFIVGGRIPKAGSLKAKRAWLVVSVVVNLTILGFFKYWDFFAESTNRLLEMIGLESSAPLLHMILPVGISFYTFQSMSYTIDVYRGKAQPTRSLLKFLVFVSLFPQLVAGPIVRYTDIEDQLDNMPPKFKYDYAALGLNFLVVGLAKKLLVADMLGEYTGPLLANYKSFGVIEAWTVNLACNLRMYYDFSGYSDMAVGLGLMLGLRLPMNFNSPYKAESFSDLWNRWHMTLTRWMRDYLFISLGGSRRGLTRMIINTIIVFGLIGLWHGANWTYVFFGLYCAIALVIENIGRMLRIRIPSAALRTFIVYTTWTISGALFYARDLSMSWVWLKASFGSQGMGSLPSFGLLAMVILCIIHTQAAPNSWQLRWKYTWYETVTMVALFMVCISRFFSEEPFIYFQF